MYEKYIPKSYRKKKETEFYHLKQGRMSVVDYDCTFCDMARYAPGQVDTEEKMAEKFCAGLRYEIRMALASHGGLSYLEALNRALDIEVAMPNEKHVTTPHLHLCNSNLTPQGTSENGKEIKLNNGKRNHGKVPTVHKSLEKPLRTTLPETTNQNHFPGLNVTRCMAGIARQELMFATSVARMATLQETAQPSPLE